MDQAVKRFPFATFLSAVIVLLAAAMTVSIVALAGGRGDAPRVLDFGYAFEVPRPAAPPVTVWVPVPMESAHQSYLGVRLAEPYPYETVREPEYGNTFLRMRFDDADFAGGAPLRVHLTFRIERRGADGGPRAIREGSPELLARFLRPDRLVPVDGPIAEEAVRTAGDGRSGLDKVRRLYDHLATTMRYDKTGEGWGRGDAVRACDLRRGNCTDFHSLFIGEARALGIPARFIIGFPIPEDRREGEVAGYHCWVEAYPDSAGWIPIDVSEAARQPGRREVYFGRFGADRIAFTMGRDIRLPGAAGEPVNFSVYPYAEAGGKPAAVEPLKFTFRELLGEGQPI